MKSKEERRVIAERITRELLILIDRAKESVSENYDINDLSVRIDDIRDRVNVLKKMMCDHPFLAGGICGVCKGVPE